jgi:hypothetical protein
VVGILPKPRNKEEQMNIKTEQCTLGAVVYQVGKSAPLTKGKISGPLSGALVIVEWESGYISKVDIKHLLSEVNGIAENQRLQDEQDRLEREFADLEVTLTDKIAQAAKLIDEAAALAGSKGKELQDMYEATRPLERAMSQAGWRTSSWNC